MNKQPLVSIIMNCYNGEDFLQQALESVKAQTYKNWELIFWDNQSADKSAEVFKNFDDPRFKYFLAPEHTLLSKARNYAIDNANGEYLAFLDVDDWWSHDKLEKQIPLFSDKDVGLVYANYWYVLNEKNIKYPLYKKILPKGRCMDELLRNYCIGLLTIIVRSKIIKNHDISFNANYHAIEDFDFVIKLSKTWKIECIQIPLAYFRHHSDNNSFLLKEKRINELHKWCKEMQNDDIIGKEKGLINLAKKLVYEEAIIYLEQRNYKAVWNCAKKLSNLRLKLRLLMKIIVPRILLYKVKYLTSKYI